ncbi:MAG: hypothetical protein KAK01_01590 [Candidatus Marinimicrobia bacterium]|nr:hypothetical protein [Candidatus Neomarinimicrobiota bacterium]
MKTVLLKLIMILSFTGLINAQENRIFWDGGDWKRITALADHNPNMTYRIKAAYVNGVLDGRLFYYLKTWAVQQSFADSLYAETVDYLTTRELVNTLDIFYADPLNTYIPIPSAIIIATMYAERISLDLIDQYIKQTKFWINELQLNMEQEGWNKLLDEKLDKHLQKTRIE